jgi:hypothetical protein
MSSNNETNYLETCLAYDEVAKSLIGCSANDFAKMLFYRQDLPCVLEKHLKGKMCFVGLRAFRQSQSKEKDPVIKSLTFMEPSYKPLFQTQDSDNTQQ